MEVYVLSNCDSCRKALKWLRDNDIAHSICDIRKDGIGANTIAAAMGALGWQKVLNRRSTSWRNLDENQRTKLDDEKAAKLIRANPTLMKRPLFVIGTNYYSGFDNKLGDWINAARV